MKKHLNLIITKFLLVAPIIGFIGPIFSHMDLGMAMLTAGMITLATYLSADLVLLPQYGTKFALTGDAVIVAAIFWEMSSVAQGAQVNFAGIFAAVVLIVWGEWYFHRYLLNTLLRRQMSNTRNTSVSVNAGNKKSGSKKKKNNKKSK